MPRFTVIARPDSISEQVKGNIITTLNNNGYTYDDNNPETVFVVGGDGTFIYAVHYVTRKLGRQLSDVCFYGMMNPEKRRDRDRGIRHAEHNKQNKRIRIKNRTRYSRTKDT